MRPIILCAAVAALASPALAQQPASPIDTLREVTTKGVVMTYQGGDMPVTYATDGSFTAAGGAVTGRWRADGDTLCVKATTQAEEDCVKYPAGKKSGDSFQVTGGFLGTVTIRIN